MAKAFGICHTTLFRYIKKKNLKKMERLGTAPGKAPHAVYWTSRKVFSEVQERSRREYLIRAADLYYGSSPREVRSIIRKKDRRKRESEGEHLLFSIHILFQVWKFALQLATHFSCNFPPQWSETGMAGGSLPF